MVDFAKRLKEKRQMARDKERKGRRRDEGDEDKGDSAEDIEKDLGELESAWSETEAQEGFGDIPDDTYQAKITGANINRSKSSKRLQLTVEFTIMAGKYKNRKKWSHYGLETPENLGWVKGLFARLKIDPPKKLGMLTEACEQLIGTTCEISVKTRGEFQNVYVQKPIDIDDAPEDADDWEPSDRSKKSKDRDDDDDDDDRKKSKKDDADDDDDDDHSSKSKRRDDDDDDEDKPKKKSRDEDDGDGDDDDDDARSKSKKDDDDDDDDRKSSKSKRDDDDDDEGDDRKKRSKDDDDDDDDDRSSKKRKSKF